MSLQALNVAWITPRSLKHLTTWRILTPMTQSVILDLTQIMVMCMSTLES